MTNKKTDEFIRLLRAAINQKKSNLYQIPYQDEQALYAVAVLLHENKNKPACLFLQKQDFEKLYPVLNEAMEWSDQFKLIVSDDVLTNDKLRKAMPYETDTFFFEEHPTLQELSKISKNIHVVNLNENENYESFLLVPNRLMFRYIDKEAFGCCLNVQSNPKERERQETLIKLFQNLNEKSKPYSPELIDKYTIDFLKLNNCQRTLE